MKGNSRLSDENEVNVAGTTYDAARRGVTAVDRALAIVSAIAESAEPLRLASLSATTGLYKSTILRLLASLERAGYVVRLRDGRYSLGPIASWLGCAYERNNALSHQVLPVLQDLVAKGSESASFHMRYGPDTRLCLLRVDSSHPTLDRVRAGDILPLDRGAAGRVLLAFAEEPGAVYERIRVDHLACSFGEREPGCAAIASPVFAADGMLVGAISLSGPVNRFTTEMCTEWGPRLVAAASELSATLSVRLAAEAT